MLRYVALVLMLSPGVAHAQKFVSVDSDADLVAVQPELATNFDSAVSEPVDETATPEGEPAVAVAESSAVTIDTNAWGSDILFDGASVEELRALLDNAAANGLTADQQNAIVALISTDEEGETVLTLGVASNAADSTGVTSASDQEAQFAEAELGECNDGTTWIANETHCHNAYPVETD